MYQDIFGRKSLVREGDTTENRHGYQSSYNNIKIKTEDTYIMEPFIPNETWVHLRADDDRGTNIQIMSIPKWFRDDSSTNKILVKAKDRNTGQVKDYVLGDVASIWNDTVMPGDYVDDDGYHSSSGESADDAIADIIADQGGMAVSDSASESDDDGYNLSLIHI